MIARFRFPDGMEFLGEDGGRARFTVSIPMDEDGFVGRECRQCYQRRCRDECGMLGGGSYNHAHGGWYCLSIPRSLIVVAADTRVDGIYEMTVSGPVRSGRIFISYRRDEAAFPAAWLHERLVNRFGPEQVFKDVDSIDLGDDFAEVITTAVASCDVLLAVIGTQWVVTTDQSGRRRLDDPKDFVRLEIEAALQRNVRVIPILVQGATMPRAEQLPSSLTKLARRQALELDPNRFEYDTARLLRVVERTLAREQAPRTPAPAEPERAPETKHDHVNEAESEQAPRTSAPEPERASQTKPDQVKAAESEQAPHSLRNYKGLVAGLLVAILVASISFLSLYHNNRVRKLSPDSTTQQSGSGAQGTAPAEDQVANTGAQGTAPAEDQAANTQHTVLKSGFGGDSQYIWAGALVRNDSNKSGGTVVANFNLLDAAGRIITSESQTEHFSYPGQELAIGAQVSLPEGAVKPTKVEVAVSVEYPGIGPPEPSQPLTFGPVEIALEQYGNSYRVAANVTNPTDQTIKSARVGILCYNAAGDIIGGHSAYPALIPPNSQVKVESSILSAGKPASCDMRAPADLL